MKKILVVIGVILIGSVMPLLGQGPSTAFSYQGSLNTSGTPATGNHDFQFLLFDGASGGTQLGATNNISGVTVTSGVFAVTLNFGDQFPGANRFLEIRVRVSGGGAFTTLTPRQQLNSSPYAVRSLTAENSTQLGGVAAANYLQTTGNGSGVTNLNASSLATGTVPNARLGQLPTANIADNAVTAAKIAAGQVVKSLNGLEDSVTLAAGSNITITPSGNTLTIASTGGGGGAILNQTTQQAGANFNIDGTGTANILNATTQFNLGGTRILSTAGTNNLFAGTNTGVANTSGSDNTFLGELAGSGNTGGTNNSFVGARAGLSNTLGDFNVFVGWESGVDNISGNSNVFVGQIAGRRNMAGTANSFFGTQTGNVNINGSGNSFLGYTSGGSNTDGNDNTFVGRNSGLSNSTGNRNVFLGYEAGAFSFTTSYNVAVGSSSRFDNNPTNATAIGYRAQASQSNSLVLGSINGVNGCSVATDCDSVNVGIGTTTPGSKLTVAGLIHSTTGGVRFPDGTTQTSAGISATNAILNQTTLQSASNFNISGTGNANILNATTQFSLNGSRTIHGAGTNNFFAGNGAGANNTGQNNSFFGRNAGNSNTTGNFNSIFGARAGEANNGSANSFFGSAVGFQNTSGSNNSFFGEDAGFANTTGSANTFVGATAGQANVDGGNNTMLGQDADLGGGSLNFATAIGSGAIVGASNRIQLGRDTLDTVRVGTLGAASATNLCITANNVLAACSSSQRYKNNIQTLGSSLGLVKNLRPVTFDWNDRAEHDLGFIAEEVGQADPLLVTRNRTGEIQGVKYDQIAVIAINAIKEQQAQIERLQKLADVQTLELGKAAETNSQLRLELNELKKLICSLNTVAGICKP